MSVAVGFPVKGLVQPPREVAALRDPWDRLSGRLPGLSIELEDEFRFGHVVTAVGDEFRLGGSIKGGSSSVWITVGEEVDEGYRAWREVEGISTEPDAEAYYRLKHRLSALSIDMRSHPEEYLPRHGGAYQLLEMLLGLLPDEHLLWLPLEMIVVGGWGPDAAKASAYRDGRIFLYDFVLGGARRTFAGILLHEMGHAFYSGLRPERKRAFENSHSVIACSGALLGTEFLLDATSRVVYQEFLVDEFAAEMYMAFVAQGGRLREFIRGLEGPGADAWRRVYGQYLDAFDGWAYI